MNFRIMKMALQRWFILSFMLSSYTIISAQSSDYLQAFTQGDYPNDPTERLVFIEGYARTGQWDKARQQTQESAAITPLLQPVLCRLWERIGQDAASSIPTGLQADIRQELECTANP